MEYCPEQIKKYKNMSPEEKLLASSRLREMAWELTAAGIRIRHPNYSEQEVAEAVKKVFLHAVR